MSWPALLLTFGSIFALACGESTPTARTPAPAGSIELAPGQTTQVGTLRIKFVGINGDSRCPTDVVCVWAGDAIARIELGTNGGSQPYDLHTLNLQPVVHGGFQVELVRLDPLPLSTVHIQPQDYRLFVRVSEAS